MRTTPAWTAVMIAVAATVSAQEAPPPTWTGAAGAGVALTVGNTDTSSINLSFKVVRDPKTRLVLSSEGLYIRGQKDGVRSADNALGNVRGTWTFAPRTFAFGQVQVIRDGAKGLEVMVAPTAGVGYKVYDGARGSFSVDAGVGASFEKDTDIDFKSHAVVAFGEKAAWKASSTATLTHALSSVIVADDWGDGIYAASLGLASAVTKHVQLKVDVVDTIKSRPAFEGLKKNDLSTIVAVVYTF